ncbi:preferentially expressed antigen in melanoma-like protein 7 [Acomys russatus]|uniref:preferentially expressed antigen in melanoma-like protein 7 n=1 Tax=Acomys russatus TaxID=60746 RepID=UPI0021E233DF|nr:preferentially expressed antigen in melanoma-like protein 7 [Acomys russatus]
MSLQAPPTLLQLAVQSLVRNEEAAISALQDLPMDLFPPLCKEADTQRKAKMIKVLVTDWPYPCLPVGLLMSNPSLATYQAMLDGADTWLTRKFRPRKQRLQVLDLRKVYHDFWDVWAGRRGRDHSIKSVLEMQVMKGHSKKTQRRHLKVVSDLSFKSSLNEHQTQLLEWAEKRKGSLQLCCVKMEIGPLEVSKVKKVLRFLQPEFIKELELNSVSRLSALADFVPCIVKMSNLQKLMLVRIFRRNTTTHAGERNIGKIISVFSKLNCLRHLTIEDVYFLKDHLGQLFGGLKATLESLSIKLCKLSQSDLEAFSQDWNHCQLKHLSLRGVALTTLNVTPLKVLLERVADTLHTLKLKDCGMKDSHLSVLLPALIRCTQLTSINFYDNDISMAALKDLLHHTANLSQLTQELYPAPVEVYDEASYVLAERFSHFCAELMNTLVAVRQPNSVCFGSYACYDCGMRYIYETKTEPCDCLQ